MAETALVLGGGGPVGGAWMVGMLAGLTEVGVALDEAEEVIGTSAGAIMGTRLRSGVPAAELYERQLTGADAIRLPVSAAQTARFVWAALGARDPQRSVERLGRAALRARTSPETAVLETIAGLLDGVTDWPTRPLRLTAVDAESGQVTAFDADSDVPLQQAVAASCAVPIVWPPVTAAGRRWMDGGSRSTANLALAHGSRRVLAVVPIPKAVGPHPSAEQEAAALTGQGVEVALVCPDRAARRAMGRNLADVDRQPDAARAGRAQAATVLEAVAGVWR